MKLTRDLLERLIKGFQAQYDGVGSNAWIHNPRLNLLSEKEEKIAKQILLEFGFRNSRDSAAGAEILKLALNFCRGMLKNGKIQ